MTRAGRRVRERDARPLAILDGVLDEIAERPFQRRRPAGIGKAGRLGEGHRLAELGEIVDLARDGGGEIDAAGRLGRRIFAGKGERRLGHALHLVERREHLRLRLVIVEKLGAELQRGDRRPQIMSDRREHARAVGDEADEPLLHPIEGSDQPPRLVGAGLGEERRRGAAAEGVGAIGERLQRPRDPPGDDHDDGEARHRHDRGGKERGERERDRLRVDLRLRVEPAAVVERQRRDDVELRTVHRRRPVHRLGPPVAFADRRRRVVEPDEGEPGRFPEAPGEHVLEFVRKHHPTVGIGGRGEGAFLGRPEADARRAGGVGEAGPFGGRREVEHAADRRDPVEEPDPVGLADGGGALVDEQEQAHRQRPDERQAEEREQLAAQRLRQEPHGACSLTSAAKL